MAKTLTVYLAADLKKFNSGMDQAAGKARGLSTTMKDMLGPALIGAGVAAGAMATKFAADGVQAFLDDEVAASKLAKTLENLGLAHDTKPVEAYIYQLERSLGIADTELRPAYDRLVRSIGDTADANRAMSIALDVSAGTGKSLESVVEALGKAYEGNISGLSRLGAGLDAATIRTGDMDEITRKLSETFAGQATTQAGTYQGQLGRLKTAVDNLAEAFGKGLVTALGETGDATDDAVTNLEKMEPLFQAVGDDAGKAATDLVDFGDKVLNTWEAWQYEARRADSVLIGLWQSISKTDDEAAALAAANRGLSDSFEYVQYAAYNTEGALDGTSTAAGIAGAALDEAGDDAATSGAQAAIAAVQYATLADAMAAAGGESFNWRREVNGSTDDARKQETALQNLIIDRKYDAWLAEQQAAANKNLGGATSSAARDTDTLTAAEKRLVKAYEDQQATYDATNKSLMQHKADLEAVTAAAEQYSSVIRSGLQSAIDIGKAYSGQFNKEGEQTGLSLYEGFQQQVDHLEWFGNVLGALKSEGAAPEFLAEIAQQGAGIGGALGEQLLGDSMVKEMSDQWVNVQTKIDELAQGLLPEFMQTGIAAGSDLVTGLAEQLAAEGKTLAKLGKKIAKPVGANFKAQLMADVAEALRAVEASASAARAEKVAQAEAEAARLTEQAVAQAIGRIVSQGDARTGRNVSPVLS
jgi:hypothetical protein